MRNRPRIIGGSVEFFGGRAAYYVAKGLIIYLALRGLEGIAGDPSLRGRPRDRTMGTIGSPYPVLGYPVPALGVVYGRLPAAGGLARGLAEGAGGWCGTIFMGTIFTSAVAPAGALCVVVWCRLDSEAPPCLLFESEAEGRR